MSRLALRHRSPSPVGVVALAALVLAGCGGGIEAEEIEEKIRDAVAESKAGKDGDAEVEEIICAAIGRDGDPVPEGGSCAVRVRYGGTLPRVQRIVVTYDKDGRLAFEGAGYD